MFIAVVKKQATFNDVCTPDRLVKDNSELFTKSQINWLIKTRHKNGLSQTGAVLKISQKIYLHKTKFIDWFLKQRAA